MLICVGEATVAGELARSTSAIESCIMVVVLCGCMACCDNVDFDIDIVVVGRKEASKRRMSDGCS